MRRLIECLGIVGIFVGFVVGVMQCAGRFDHGVIVVSTERQQRQIVEIVCDEYLERNDTWRLALIIEVAVEADEPAHIVMPSTGAKRRFRCEIQGEQLGVVVTVR